MIHAYRYEDNEKTWIFRTAEPYIGDTPRWTDKGCPPFSDVEMNIFNFVLSTTKYANYVDRGNRNPRGYGWAPIPVDHVQQIIELFEMSGVEYIIHTEFTEIQENMAGI